MFILVSSQRCDRPQSYDIEHHKLKGHLDEISETTSLYKKWLEVFVNQHLKDIIN